MSDPVAEPIQRSRAIRIRIKIKVNVWKSVRSVRKSSASYAKRTQWAFPDIRFISYNERSECYPPHLSFFLYAIRHA